ncbi:hypothetical protein BGX38DRAFT_1272925 [Terfezia claveryi]|nr:hypothetical protein BGX38DRAFT_1272925 [Terfezia claveryi]
MPVRERFHLAGQVEVTRKWWVELVAKAANAAYEGHRRIIIAGDLNAEDEAWMGDFAGGLMWEELRNPLHGEIIAGIAEVAGLKPIFDEQDPFTRRGANVRQSAIDMIWASDNLKAPRKRANVKKISRELAEAEEVEGGGWWSFFEKLVRRHQILARETKSEPIWSEKLEKLKRQLHRKSRKSVAQPVNKKATEERKEARNAFRRELRKCC